MNELQSKLLDMLKWFHALCESENLTYYAVAGTVLGAVRHKGFIPWDDDIDVGMPRSDYNILKEKAASLSKGSRYVIEFPEGNNYTYGFCKVYDTETTLVENIRGKVRRGIYLDVFPIDGAGDTMDESVKNFHKLDRCRDFFRLQSIALSNNRNFFKNTVVAVSRVFLGVFYPKAKVLGTIEKNAQKYDYHNSKYIVNLFGAYREREIFEREWVQNPVLCEFEGTNIYIPNDYHNYLTRQYGNYMQLPPEEKRISHHDYVCMDLERSYLK